MSCRSIAWVIFLGFLALVGAGGVLGVGTGAVQYGIWGFWLVLTAGLVWVYAHTRSSAIGNASSIPAASISCLSPYAAGCSMK